MAERTDDIVAASREQSNRSIPSATIRPVLEYPDVAAAAGWLCAAFGLRERLSTGDHRVQLTFGTGALVVARGEVPPGGVSVMVRVQDAATHAARCR